MLKYNYMETINNLMASSSWLTQLPPQVWGITAIGVTTLLAIVVIWSLIWKGLALWKAARNGSKWWFVIILIVNTLGLLEILYYFFLDNKKSK